MHPDIPHTLEPSLKDMSTVMDSRNPASHFVCITAPPYLFTFPLTIVIVDVDSITSCKYW